MCRKGFGHVILFRRFQKTDQIFNGRVFVMMAAVAGIWLLIDAASLQSGLGVHESESVTMCVPGFADARHPGHVTAHTAAESVNPVY